MSNTQDPGSAPAAPLPEKVYRVEAVYECTFTPRRNTCCQISGITLVSGSPFVGGFGLASLFIGAAAGAAFGGNQ